MNNIDVFKTTIEHDLKEIAKCKLDILILNRQNDVLCKQNNEEIERLNNVVGNRELSLEENLSKSGEKKIETSAGWCAYRIMPDSWEYDLPKLIRWAKEDDERAEKYIKVVEEFKKAQFKKDYTEDIIGHDDVCDEGLTITPQEPRFNYKIKGGL